MFAKTLVLWQTARPPPKFEKAFFAGISHQELQNEPSMAFLSCSQAKILNAHTHAHTLKNYNKDER